MSTPGIFNLTCVGKHTRRQLVEYSKVIFLVLNAAGGNGEWEEASTAGSYMVVLKRIDVEQLISAPASFPSKEKNIIKWYMSACKPEENLQEKVVGLHTFFSTIQPPLPAVIFRLDGVSSSSNIIFLALDFGYTQAFAFPTPTSHVINCHLSRFNHSIIQSHHCTTPSHC